jgi:hypothetical protein
MRQATHPVTEPVMPNNLKVTLDETKTPWAVDVDQKGKDNEVGQGPNAQTITWQLNGNAASGSFVSLSDPNPGFEWTTAPPPGVFGQPTLSPNGNQLTMTDTNTGAGTTGTWTSVLRVDVGNTVYSSRTESITGTDTNPWIKNK